MVPAAMKSEDICFLAGKLWETNINSVLRSRNIILSNKLIDVWPFHLDSYTFCPVPFGLRSALAFRSFMIPNIILHISLTSPEISHLFKNPCIVWMGNVFRSYMLDLRIVTVIKLSLLVGFIVVKVGSIHFP